MSWLDDPLAIPQLGDPDPTQCLAGVVTDHPSLLEPYTYIAESGGKEIRTRLIEAFNLWLNVPESDLGMIRHVVRMLHNASLLCVFITVDASRCRATEEQLTLRMDDVEDNSELRRGKPVAHLIYGVPQTINTANYVYFQAMQLLIQTTGPAGTEVGLVTGMFPSETLSSSLSNRGAVESTSRTRTGSLLEG